MPCTVVPRCLCAVGNDYVLVQPQNLITYERLYGLYTPLPKLPSREASELFILRYIHLYDVAKNCIILFMMASQGFLAAIEKISDTLYYRVLVHNQEGNYNSLILLALDLPSWARVVI